MLPSIALLVLLAYIAVLFLVARLGNRHALLGKTWVRNPLVYTLSLGVYCTSWTFYGLVGTAADSGLNFMPILLGPILLFLFGYPLLCRVARITREEKLSSIADFIASRYGKRRGIASVTALVVMIATIPYIALQIKAVSDSVSLLFGQQSTINVEVTIITSGSMIVFSLLFGAQTIGEKNYNAGLITAIAFESIVKFIAMAAVAVLAVSILLDKPDLSREINYPIFSNFDPSVSFFVQSLVSAGVIFCLPRMFHVCFVENHSDAQIHSARFSFSAYLGLLGIFIILIASAGNVMFQNVAVPSDHFILAIPIASNSTGLSEFAFLGGFSAATAMIIVATITLSQIISNDIILPVVVERDKAQKRVRDYSRTLLIARRATVVFVIVMAYAYQRTLANNIALTSIGLIAFALAIQLAPALIGGVYWRRANANGVYAGVACGSLIWLYTLFMPLLSRAGLGFDQLMGLGPFGIDFLRPESLLGFQIGDAYSHGVILSLATNSIVLAVISRRTRVPLLDRIQAQMFTTDTQALSRQEEWRDVRAADLEALMIHFTGERWLADMHSTSGFATQDALAEAEQTLAGITGVATARSLLDNINPGGNVNVAEVVSIVRDTTRALRFNQDILYASFENVPTGISVVNKDLELVAWNSLYERIFNMPSEFLQIGMPISNVARYNAQRGMLGAGDIEELVQRRMRHLLQGEAYQVRRQHDDNTIIEIKGRPLPNGGYVTTYDDVSKFIQAQTGLERARDQLEERVRERTETIGEINKYLMDEIGQRKAIEAQLLEAKADAEYANNSKSEFLALASHDILQPLNAANLFTDALLQKDGNPDKTTVQSLKSSITSATSIISTLMEISKLDTGALQPHASEFRVTELFESLMTEFSVLAISPEQLRYVPSSLAVNADRSYLRRIIQNFLSNALKYGGEGTVLLGCRNRGSQVEICVFDQGPGISNEEQRLIFCDFYRSKRHAKLDGLGLGLSVTSRLSGLMGALIEVRSAVDRGSCFSIRVPKVTAYQPDKKVRVLARHPSLSGLRVMYVDDDSQNLSAMVELLTVWECDARVADDVESAIDLIKNGFAPDVLLMDYQLSDPAIDGIDLALQLQNDGLSDQVKICIVSAAPNEDLRYLAAEAGFAYIRKPVKPAKLMAYLSS